MTTLPNAADAGSIDSVAESLLLAPEQDQREDDTPQAETDAEDDAAPAEALEADQTDVAEDDGDAEGDTDETTDEGDGPEEPQEATFRVKVDGEEVEVTLTDLKRSYAGQGYIQKRMAEIAGVRKEAEQVYHALTAERQQVLGVLQAYEQQMAQNFSVQPPPEELMTSDPMAYMEQDRKYRKAMEAKAALRQQYEIQQQALAQHQQRAAQAYLAEQREILAQRIPEFADPEKGRALQERIVKTAMDAYGFSPQEMSSVMDARHVQVLADAIKYRQLQAGKQTAARKAETGQAPVVRPGARRSEVTSRAKAEKAARSRMKQSGAVDDVAAFLITKG